MLRALLYPGNGSSDLRVHRDNAEAGSRGYLAVTSTPALAEYIANPEFSDEPRTHFRQPTYNPALVRAWLRHAGIAPDSPFSPFNIYGMRLIDCEENAVVDRQDDMPYLALSYVWGLANNDIVHLETRGDEALSHSSNPKSLPGRIPRVVANAMTVTIDLGYRYLWVDQFCIDQKSDMGVLADHVSRMDQVYMSAQLTIVATSTCGALPGVADTPRAPQGLLSVPARRVRKLDANGTNDEDLDGYTLFTTSPHAHNCVKNSVWFQRGWCFQESVLSSARLYFTDHETLFQAHDFVFSESFPEPHDMLEIVLDGYEENMSLGKAAWKKRIRDEWTRDMYSLRDPRGQFSAGLSFLIQLLQVYTEKELTQDMDSINGFRGVLRFFSSMTPGFAAVAGVPVFWPKPVTRAQDSAVDEKLQMTSEEGHQIHEGPMTPQTQQPSSSAKQSQPCFDDCADRPSSDTASTVPVVQETNHFQQRCLTSMLLWRHECYYEDESSVLRRRPGFPSWSWAGWKGQASWDTVAIKSDMHRDEGDGDDSCYTDSEESGEDEDEDEDGDEDGDEDENEDEDEDEDESEDEEGESEDEDEDGDQDQANDSDNDNEHEEDDTTSTGSPTPRPSSYGWQINALGLRDGRVIPLSQQPSPDDNHSITTPTAFQLDSVMYLIGEAFILPSSSIVLTHTASNMRDASRAYKVAMAIEMTLDKTISYFEMLRHCTIPRIRRLLRGIPWLGSHLQLGSDTRSSVVTAVGPRFIARPFMRGLYHFSHYLRFSKLGGLLHKLHASAVHLSIAELARLPQKSLSLEQDVRARLDDGLWGLLVVDATNCLVVEWHIDADKVGETDSVSTAMDDGRGSINRELRNCSRVGLLEFRHYLHSGPEVEMDRAAIFSRAEKVQFRLA